MKLHAKLPKRQRKLLTAETGKTRREMGKATSRFHDLFDVGPVEVGDVARFHFGKHGLGERRT